MCAAMGEYWALTPGAASDPLSFNTTQVRASASAAARVKAASGEALAPTTPSSILRARLEEAKVPAAELKVYASTSLRKGGVSRAYAHGVSKEAIKSHGQWRSDAVEAYISPSRAQHFAVAKAIFMSDSDGDDA